jgi:hypothetical protein
MTYMTLNDAVVWMGCLRLAGRLLADKCSRTSAKLARCCLRQRWPSPCNIASDTFAARGAESEERICARQTEDAKQQDEPGIVGVPAKIRNLGSVTSVHEQQLWGAVAGIFQAELLADAT